MLAWAWKRLLAKRGEALVLVCRTQEKAEATKAQLQALYPNAGLTAAVAEWSDLSSVHACVN